MVVTYHITGTIEVDLSKEEIKGLNVYKSEAMKKSYLEDLLKSKLNVCSMTAEHELDVKVDFENVEVEKDWNKYPGSIVDLDKNEPVGSPLGIYIEKEIPTTYDESVANAMIEIGCRKKNKKR